MTCVPKLHAGPFIHGKETVAAADFDILVIGSGPSGAQAARGALLCGARVGLIDVGNEDSRYRNLTPGKSFSELRRTDPGQQRYFLGEESEYIEMQESKVAAQFTPARRFITQDTSNLLPVDSDTFAAVQSLALGGLGAGWGAGCACFEAEEMAQVGLPWRPMQHYYQKVAEEIGVSGPEKDDTSTRMTSLTAMQPPLELDDNAGALWASYQKKRGKLIAGGFALGRPVVAILTQKLGEREPNAYHDMDFWSDAGKSVYRPRYTISELQSDGRFSYLRPFLAERFEEERDGTVSVRVRNLKSSQVETITGRRLLLAAGAINTARLAMRSLDAFGMPVPILSNPYTYLPCINLPMFGRRSSERRHSMVQLRGVFVPGRRPAPEIIANFYSYRSLLLFRLAQGMPLPPRLAMLFTRAIVDSLMIVGISHADEASPRRWMKLLKKPDGSDFIEIRSRRSMKERRIFWRQELSLVRRLMALKLAPLGLMHLPEGASIHYAGTLPFSEADRPLTCDAGGRLRGMQNVYVADGSTFRFLPAKGLTFSLMANARRIAEQVAGEL